MIQGIDDLDFRVRIANPCGGNRSVGRAQPCQGWGREFESRFPLQISKPRLFEAFLSFRRMVGRNLRRRARWQSGHAAACKAVDAGSIPTLASILVPRWCGGMVYTQDLKSCAPDRACGFESHHQHHRFHARPKGTGLRLGQFDARRFVIAPVQRGDMPDPLDQHRPARRTNV